MRTTGLAVVGVLLVVAIAAGRSPAPEQGKGTPVDAIKAIADQYVKAVMASDAKAVAALYTDDAIEMPPNAPMIKGRAAIEQYYVKEFSGGVKIDSFTIAHIDTQATGNSGYDVGTYKQSVTPKGATAAVTDSGKYTVIVKQSAGAWKVAYAIYNSDQPPPK